MAAANRGLSAAAASAMRSEGSEGPYVEEEAEEGEAPSWSSMGPLPTGFQAELPDTWLACSPSHLNRGGGYI